MGQSHFAGALIHYLFRSACPDLAHRKKSAWEGIETHLVTPRSDVLSRAEQTVFQRLGHDVLDGRISHGEKRDDVGKQLLVLFGLLQLGVRVLEGLQVRAEELEGLRDARHGAA